MSRTRKLDGELAQKLFDKLGSWSAVARAIEASTGQRFNIGSLSVAACKWRQAQGRAPQQDAGLGAIWSPPLPRKLKVVPDYRTGTVRPA